MLEKLNKTQNQEEDFSQGLDYPAENEAGFEGLMSGENPDLLDKSKNETGATVLSLELRRTIEGEKGLIFEDYPEIAYVSAFIEHPEFIGKPFIYYRPNIRDLSTSVNSEEFKERTKQRSPSFSDTAGRLANVHDMLDRFVEECGDVSFDRSMVSLVSENPKIKEITGFLAHFPDGFHISIRTTGPNGTTTELKNWPPELSADYIEGFFLNNFCRELLSPIAHKYAYKNFPEIFGKIKDGEIAPLLTDYNLFLQLIQHPSFSSLREKISNNYGNDPRLLQERLCRFYSDFWPTEIRKMKQSRDKVKKWLGLLAEKYK